MQALVLGVILLLLVFVMVREKKNPERLLWLKIIFLYLMAVVTFWLGQISIPIGILIVGIFVWKKSKQNKSLKFLTLSFALVAFILIHYVVPPIEFQKIPSTSEIAKDVNRFEHVEHIKLYDKEDAVQEQMKEYDEQEPYVMFPPYVLMERGISIKNEEWLLYDSRKELDYYLSAHTREYKTTRISSTSSRTDGTEVEVYMRFNQTGEEYLGVFKSDGDDMYLAYVIKGQFMLNQEPKMFFQ